MTWVEIARGRLVVPFIIRVAALTHVLARRDVRVRGQKTATAAPSESASPETAPVESASAEIASAEAAAVPAVKRAAAPTSRDAALSQLASREARGERTIGMTCRNLSLGRAASQPHRG